ncbi:MAG: HD domain-containing protein [Candidatus Sericytochromatia bacterium]|nr:HD domain-containing protein [Candidatus Sericytochromatia bacterium]
MSRLLAAVKFASEKHKFQKRKDKQGSPYINHPIKVAELIWNKGEVRDIDVIIAALLHDTVEDTDTSIEEIKKLFGDKVALYVSEVTDDKKLQKEERKKLQIKHSPNISHGAKQVKFGDKISNISDIAESPPCNWDFDRRRQYLEWSNNVVKGLRGSNDKLEAIFDDCLTKSEIFLDNEYKNTK